MSLLVRRSLDAVCVLALTAVALWGFDTTFLDRAYLVTGLVGAGLVVSIAAVVAAKAPRSDIYALVAAAFYVPVGAVAALHTFLNGELPTGSDLLSVLTATITAPGDLLNTIPPLDSTGSVLVLPYALGYLGAGTSIWLAYRTPRPLAPIVPLVLVDAVVILLGAPRSSGSSMLAAALFAGVGFWWAAARGLEPARRLTPGLDPPSGRWLRAVAAAVVVAVVSVSVWQLAPASSLGGDRIVLRGRVGHGASIDQFDNPLVNFRRFTQQTDDSPDNTYDKTLFVLSGLSSQVALRFVTLDSYDGQTWSAGNRTVPDVDDDLFQRIGSQVSASRAGYKVAVGVKVKEAYIGAWLPLAGQLTSVSFDFLDGRAQRSDVRYNPATACATVVGGLSSGDDYHFTAVVPTAKIGGSTRSYPTTGPLQPAGAPLDALLQPWRQSGRAPLQQVLLLAKYLKANGRYSDGNGDAVVPPGESVERLGTEFFGAKRILGDDEQYAAFMALAANRLGVPARVVVGAYAGNGKVKGSNVLAWVELRVGDGSWRTLPTSSFMTHRPPKPGDKKQPPSDFVQQAQTDDQSQQPDAQQQVPQPTQQAAQPGATAPAGGAPGPRWPYGVVLLALLVWAVPAAKALRRLARRRRAAPSARVAGAWRELLDSARDLGVPVPTGGTRDAQARLLGVDPGLAGETDARIFGPEPPTAVEAAEVWRAMDGQRRAVARRRPRWRRLVAPFNPASLVPASRSGRPRRRGLSPRRVRAV